MGTRTQHTKTDLSRCVARLLLAAQHARLAVGSRRGGPPLVRVRFGGQQPSPCQRTGPCSIRLNIFLLSCARFRELFFAVVVSSNGLCLALWPRACAACSSCRSGDAPPRYEQGAEQRFLFRRKPKSRGDIGRRSIFFDFRLAFFSPRRASLGGARFFVFFFFFVLLSEDTHRRSPHVAVGVTRRLTLRKCLACASHVDVVLHAHFPPPTPTPSLPPKNPDSHSLPLQPAHRTHTCASNN